MQLRNPAKEGSPSEAGEVKDQAYAYVVSLEVVRACFCAN